MEKRAWAKVIVSLLVIGGIAVGLYIRWGATGLGSDPLSAWGRGNPTLSERTYYLSRINRIIEEWAQTARRADHERDGRFKDSYRALFVIDLDKQAVWIEENGQPRKNHYSELPPGMRWQFHHVTPQGNKELSGRIVLKMRGAYTRQQEPEAFFLVGAGRGGGHFNFQFHPSGSGGGSYNSGSYRLQPYHSRSSGKADNPYGSLLVTDSEYEQYGADGSKRDARAGTWIEENRANWLRVEKSLYGQIERHLRNAGYELHRLKVEPGPDFSAGYAEARGRSDSALRGIFGGYSSPEAYLKLDYVGDDIWYAKSGRRYPERPVMPGRTLDLEFLVHATSQIADSQRNDLLAKGRKIQQPDSTAPSKWKVTLASGAMVEFIGICENPSAGKQWWGPDGSPVDRVPYTNAQPYARARDDREYYEFAWRVQIEDTGRGYATRHSLEGEADSYYVRIRDRYGNHVIQGVSAEGYGFDKARQKATWRLGLASENWQTALVVEDEAAETKFLDKQRVILNPPEMENGQIVVRCFEGSGPEVRDYETDFALMLSEDLASKTVSLGRYLEDVSNDSDTGLRQHKFTLKDVNMSQIEGVCFRYRPYEFVTFKNISLVPGRDAGFEIELGQ